MEGLQNTDKVREDFDRLADLSEEGWDHNVHYQDLLLGRLPESAGRHWRSVAAPGPLLARYRSAPSG